MGGRGTWRRKENIRKNKIREEGWEEGEGMLGGKCKRRGG